jgi:2-polyprenyl-3-methyl-5-hydroxy-6-metoxy-1,4-benzoquinol methylase
MPLAIADRFAHLRTPHNRHFFEALAEHFSPPSDNPCLPMWFEYAITTNDRGRAAAARLQKYADLRGKRYLDVGCAHGGFLVAFAEQGADVAGIDINEKLLKLARSNLRDHGLEAPLLLRDATRPQDLAEFSRRIDVVTCNDVIEHVLDPAATIANIAGVLRPGGLAYFEIPNWRFPRFVIEDGHYLLFGITLLDRPEAEQYYSLRVPGDPYTVGHYLDIAQYTQLFARAGMRLRVLEDDLEAPDLQTVENDLNELRTCAPERLSSVPEPVRPAVAERLERYLSEIDSVPRSTDRERRDFMLRYGTAFWRVLGHKTEGHFDRGMS